MSSSQAFRYGLTVLWEHLAFARGSEVCTASPLLPGYHARRLSDNLINPIAPPALFRYACPQARIAMAGQPATPSGQDHLLKFKSLERSPSLPQEIVASLTGALLAGELRPGDRLPSE